MQGALQRLAARRWSHGWPQASPELPVVMAGMVGAAIGWQAVPYLEGGTPLSALARHLTPVAQTPAGGAGSSRRAGACAARAARWT